MKVTIFYRRLGYSTYSEPVAVFSCKKLADTFMAGSQITCMNDLCFIELEVQSNEQTT